MDKPPFLLRTKRTSDTEITERGRRRSFDRDAALRAAMFCFWEFGYDSTTIRMLADCMGIKLPSLYAAFSSKSALFTEALDAYERTHNVFEMDAFDNAPSLEAAIHQHLQIYIKRITAKTGWGCMLLGSSPSAIPENRKIVLRLRSRRESYEAHLRLALSGAWLEPNAAVPAAADLVLLLAGLSSRARDGVSRVALKAMGERQSHWIARHHFQAGRSKR